MAGLGTNVRCAPPLMSFPWLHRPHIPSICFHSIIFASISRYLLCHHACPSALTSTSFCAQQIGALLLFLWSVLALLCFVIDSFIGGVEAAVANCRALCTRLDSHSPSLRTLQPTVRIRCHWMRTMLHHCVTLSY